MNKEKIFEELELHNIEIEKLGITKESIRNQLEIFERGALFIKVNKPCTIGDGIQIIDESVFEEVINLHKTAAQSGRLTYFVPASGAATRMFKQLQSYLNKSKGVPFFVLREEIFSDSDAKAVYEFLSNIKCFAFYDKLKSILKKENIDIDNLNDDDDISIVLKSVLDENGLNYSFLPKGAILFHKYNNECRTPFEEHLYEAAISTGNEGNIKIHFTISEEHSQIFSDIINETVKRFENNNVHLEVSSSFQKKSTNTITLTTENQLFKDSLGIPVFRPAGHGALIENLNELEADIILIKNIDNILPSGKNELPVKYKKIMTGYLISVQKEIFSYLRQLENKKINELIITEIKEFSTRLLSKIFPAEFDKQTNEFKSEFLFSVLNRPLRVCGMVKNEGHPGGGPFWVKNSEGEISLQIIEESQININNPKQFNIFKSSTHFNPVDLVCGVRDFKGRNFDLRDFVDRKSGLITTKSYEGNAIKTLELPGLWNGAMAYWNSIFVEIPSETFNPVKVVNDLLKPAHQL